MFKEVYKQALDKQNPKDGLLEEILLKSKSETLHKVKPKYNFTKITSWSASVAAALVVVVCFAVYPQLTGIHNERRAQDDLYQKQTQELKNNYAEPEDDALKLESDAEIKGSEKEPENNSNEIVASDNKSSATEKANVLKRENEKNITASAQDSDAYISPSAEIEHNTTPANEIIIYQESAADVPAGAYAESDGSGDAAAYQAESDFKPAPAADEPALASGGGGGSAASRIITAPASEASDDSLAIAYSGDVIFDTESAINEAKKYIAEEYINANAYEQDGIWYISFYTESEVVTISLEAYDGTLIEITRQNI